MTVARTAGGDRGRRHRPVAVAVGVIAAMVVGSAVAPTRATADDDEPRPAEDATEQAAELLERARAATAAPHSGRVSIVSFTAAGPRVAELAVTVDDGEVVLRPTRVIIGSAGVLDGADDRDAQRVPTAPLGLDVEGILDGWDLAVGPAVSLDTGTAVPVQLVRASGTAIRETLYVDEATGIPVRRETHHADGSVLRVVAYTSLHAASHASEEAAPGHTAPEPDEDVAADLRRAADAGFTVDSSLGAGFVLAAVRTEGSMAVARYTDGLSVLSVYQQHGALDPDALEGAEVRHVAGRDVFSWPGREPVRYVWTGDGRTWIAVSDAPAPVIEGALTALPGDLVGHDAPHRLRRGLDRVWEFVTAPLR